MHKPLKNACERAGVPYLSPHQLGRHTYATWLRRYAGRDLRGLMEDVGWKSINSAVRYAMWCRGRPPQQWTGCPKLCKIRVVRL